MTDELTEKVLADLERAREQIRTDPLLRQADAELREIVDSYREVMGPRAVSEELIRVARKLADELGMTPEEFAAHEAAHFADARLRRITGGRK